ncbi:MAG: hypothetical protein PHF92_10885 [Bacteroidales bacterium]|nr:hypothetical protein [Bacteroidales bacterium]
MKKKKLVYSLVAAFVIVIIVFVYLYSKGHSAVDKTTKLTPVEFLEEKQQ